MKPPNYPIESVDNALRLLLALLERPSMTVSDCSELLGVAPSTAHRLLAMLQYRGFVGQDPAARHYRAGPVLLKLGLAAVRDIDVRRAARPVLERLSLELDETVNLVVRQGADILFVDCVESPRIIRVGSRTGITLPAHCTSGGKALLAEMSREELREIYPNARLAKMTNHSLTKRTELEKRLAEVRARGYATNFGESENELSAVAVAIQGPHERPVGAIAVAAPKSRLPDDQVDKIVKALLQASKDISAEIPESDRRPV
ncbi:MAG: IclR family transcriptional regulator [Mycobacteriales bacterium]